MFTGILRLLSLRQSVNRRYFSSGFVEPFRTFIFLDLETTGLQRPISITELCLIAVSRGRLLRRYPGKPEAPRVLDKFTVCVKPRRRIQHLASALSGLSNAALANHQGFDEDLAFSIMTFIKRQPQPCCLVGHNGDSYDFEIFVAHLFAQDLELPRYVKAVDSLKGFRFVQSRDNPGLVKVKKAFNLSSLFERLIGDEYFPHSAEYDCIALMKCVQKTPSLIPWMDENAHDITLSQDVKSSIIHNKSKVMARSQKFLHDKNLILPNQPVNQEEPKSEVFQLGVKESIELDNVQCVHVNSNKPQRNCEERNLAYETVQIQSTGSVKNSDTPKMTSQFLEQTSYEKVEYHVCTADRMSTEDEYTVQKKPSNMSTRDNTQKDQPVLKPKGQSQEQYQRPSAQVALPKIKPSIKVPVVRQEYCLRTDGDFMVRNDNSKH